MRAGRLLAGSLLALACACTGGKPRAAMTDGQRMYLAKCTACHSAYEPSEYPPKAWVAAIDEMEQKKRIHLSPAERALILEYLTGSPSGTPVASR